MSDDALEDLIAEFVARRDAGEALDAEAFCAEHPEVGDVLRAALARIAATEALFPSSAATARDRVGPYRIRGEIGHGGMGRVLEVEHEERPGTPLALKLLTAAAALDPRAVERLRREGEILSRLAHPGIVRVRDVGILDGTPFVAMDRLHGMSLAQAIGAARERGGSVELPGAGTVAERAARLAAQIARAVAAAHGAGLLHRDIKPANVFVTDAGEPVLIDFGLAAGDSGPTLTRTGDVLGTPHYMAPEQARGERATERSDVYGIGAVVYELLTLAPPHSGHDSVQVLDAVRSRPPRPLRRAAPDVPTPIATIVHRAMAFAPARRYPTAEALALDLEAFVDGRPIAARAPGLGERAALVWQFHRRGLAAGAGVLAIVVLATLSAWPRGPGPAERLREATARAAAAIAAEDDAALLAAAEALAAEDPELALAVRALAQDRAPAADAAPRLADLSVGIGELQRGEHAAAVDSFARAARAMPGSPLPVVLRGMAALEARQLDFAEQELTAALRLLPGSADVRRQLAEVHRRRERHESAAELLQQAVEVRDDDPRTWRDLARTRLSLGRLEPGLAAIDRSIELSGERVEPLQRRIRGKLLEALKRYDEAKAVFRALIADHPRSSTFRRDLTVCLDYAHENFEARDAYLRWIEDLPDDPTGRIMLGYMYAGANRAGCEPCDAFYSAHPEFLRFDDAERLALEALSLDRGSDQAVVSSAIRIAQQIDRRDAIRARMEELLDAAHAERNDARILVLTKAVHALAR